MVYFNNNKKKDLILINACRQRTCIFRIPCYKHVTSKHL